MIVSAECGQLVSAGTVDPDILTGYLREARSSRP